MSEIKQIKCDIAASLWVIPCNSTDLKKRCFLKNKSSYGIDIILQQMISDGLIYYKDGQYMCYKKTAKKLNKHGYELYIPEKEELSEFQKSYRKTAYYQSLD